MRDANFTQAMLANGVTRIQHYEADGERKPFFAVQLDYDSRMIGTGPTVADAFNKAVVIRDHLNRKAA